MKLSHSVCNYAAKVARIFHTPSLSPLHVKVCYDTLTELYGKFQNLPIVVTPFAHETKLMRRVHFLQLLRTNFLRTQNNNIVSCVFVSREVSRVVSIVVSIVVRSLVSRAVSIVVSIVVSKLVSIVLIRVVSRVARSLVSTV